MSISIQETTLAKLGEVLPGVLEELRTLSLKRRPYVIVESRPYFVQFGRVIRAAPGIAPVGEMAFDVPSLGIYLQGFGNDPAEGTRLAIHTLKMWLPEEAKLTVTLDGEPLS